MNFAQLALICLVAGLGPVLSLPRTVHLPVVIGELVVGLALGRTSAQVLHPDNETFPFLANVGFALVMCVAVTHVPIRNRAMRIGAPLGAARAVGGGGTRRARRLGHRVGVRH